MSSEVIFFKQVEWGKLMETFQSEMTKVCDSFKEISGNIFRRF